ncbi:MAG: recombinase family protein [Firmicutes bacterium]|nr:recombinase family protein [Bacillota bacterium]
MPVSRQEFPWYTHMAMAYGIALRSVTEPIDMATPMGQTIFAALAGMAAQERLAIIQRTLAGKKEKAKKGGLAGGPAPLGYVRDKEDGLQLVPWDGENYVLAEGKQEAIVPKAERAGQEVLCGLDSSLGNVLGKPLQRPWPEV